MSFVLRALNFVTFNETLFALNNVSEIFKCQFQTVSFLTNYAVFKIKKFLKSMFYQSFRLPMAKTKVAPQQYAP
jgi:hypothetical protein